MDGGAVGNARAGVRKYGGTVERNGAEVVPEVGVRRGDADGLNRFQGEARRRGALDRVKDAAADSAGVHLLELEEGFGLNRRGGGGGGHRSCRGSQGARR